MSDIVSVKVSVNYVAWQTPNYATIEVPPVNRQEGMKEAPKFAVEELAPAALNALAKQWLDHLYAKCGRESPFKLTGSTNP